MANGKQSIRHRGDLCIHISDGQPLWQFEFAEVTGHNLEARGRKEVNRLLETGWRLLHIYTLRYEEHGVWRERPMAILGRLKQDSRATLAALGQELPAEFADRKKGKGSQVISLPVASPRFSKKATASVSQGQRCRANHQQP